MTELENMVADVILGDIKNAASGARNIALSEYAAFVSAAKDRASVTAAPTATASATPATPANPGLRVQFQDGVAAVEKEFANLKTTGTADIAGAISKLRQLVTNTL